MDVAASHTNGDTAASVVGGAAMFGDNIKGVLLAVASSAFIGASFIIKKKGLNRSSSSGDRAGAGGHTYLLDPLWWVGMITMIVGEIANFLAYIFAPAVLVTPLGALSIIVSAILAHFILKEKLQRMGVLGCVLCIVGSTVVVLHAPAEKTPSSVEQIWNLATQPAFLLYVASTVAVSLVLMLHCAPRYGRTNILVYVGICSVIGSLTVMSIKAVGIAIMLTIEGISQAGYYQTWVFTMIAISCIIIQLNYLNMALDTFNTAVVSPIYYAMFTTLTLLASAILFKDWSGQSASGIASEICGFITIISGTTVLHSTREPSPSSTTGSPDHLYYRNCSLRHSLSRVLEAFQTKSMASAADERTTYSIGVNIGEKKMFMHIVGGWPSLFAILPVRLLSLTYWTIQRTSIKPRSASS